MKANTVLRHKKNGHIVVFKCMVNSREFRTVDDFQFLLSDFEEIEQPTIEQKEQALRNINFFVGSLTDEAIEYYYNKLIA